MSTNVSNSTRAPKRASANLDGSDQKTLLFAEGNLTGVAYAELPVGPT